MQYICTGSKFSQHTYIVYKMALYRHKILQKATLLLLLGTLLSAVLVPSLVIHFCGNRVADISISTANKTSFCCSDDTSTEPFTEEQNNYQSGSCCKTSVVYFQIPHAELATSYSWIKAPYPAYVMHQKEGVWPSNLSITNTIPPVNTSHLFPSVGWGSLRTNLLPIICVLTI